MGEAWETKINKHELKNSVGGLDMDETTMK
jgi:hypothetical protein